MKLGAFKWTLLITVLAAVCVVNCVLLVGALRKIGVQAMQGDRARVTQCRAFPVSLKLYTIATERYQLLTPEELEAYKAAQPKNCPK